MVKTNSWKSLVKFIKKNQRFKEDLITNKEVDTNKDIKVINKVDTINIMITTEVSKEDFNKDHMVNKDHTIDNMISHIDMNKSQIQTNIQKKTVFMLQICHNQLQKKIY